jgi:uncharacterized protein YjbI with pentapeptide repeats
MTTYFCVLPIVTVNNINSNISINYNNIQDTININKIVNIDKLSDDLIQAINHTTISLLSRSQIQKLTDHQFSLLNNEQFFSFKNFSFLTKKQLNMINLNGLNNIHLIPQSIFINLSNNQISNLTDLALRSLTTQQITYMTQTQTQQLTNHQLSVLTKLQSEKLNISFLNNNQYSGLNLNDLLVLQITNINVSFLSQQQLSSFTNINYLTQEQLNMINLNWLNNINLIPEDKFINLTTGQITNLNRSSINLLTPQQISHMTLDQWKSFSYQQISYLSLLQIQQIPNNYLLNITSTQMQGLFVNYLTESQRLAINSLSLDITSNIPNNSGISKGRNYTESSFLNFNLSDCNFDDCTFNNLCIMGPLNPITTKIFNNISNNGISIIEAKDQNTQIKNKYLIGPGADISYLDLSGVDLRGINLSNVKVSSNTTMIINNDTIIGPLHKDTQILENSSPYNILDISGRKYLVGPNANLNKLNFSGANLNDIDLSGVIFTDTISPGKIKNYNNNTKLPLNYQIYLECITGPNINYRNII